MFDALTSPGLSPVRRRRVEGVAALGILGFSPGALSERLPTAPDGTWLAADLSALDAPVRLEANLLEEFSKHPDDLPAQLHDEFAAALWDPNERRLTLARDAMGARPLCYSYQPGRCLAFASLPKGLHGSGVVERQPSLTQLGLLLVQMTLERDQTGWEGIEWLPAGHTLTLTPGGMESRRSWRPDRSRVGTWKGTPDDAARELRVRIEASVRSRLPDGPAAAHLSGGLDSSAITVIAARELRRRGSRLHTFSYMPAPGTPGPSEWEFVAPILVQEPDIHWAPVHLTPSSDLPTDPDLPGLDIAAEHFIARASESAGARVILSGVGGDEAATFHTADVYTDLVRSGRPLYAAREIARRARLEGAPLGRALASRLLLPVLPERLMDVRRRRLGQIVAGDAADRRYRYLSPEFAAQVRAALPMSEPRTGRAAGRTAQIAAGLDPRANTCAIIGARYGVAYAYPLADRRVVDFCHSLPLEMLVSDGYSRQPFRNSMEGILPEVVRFRQSKYSAFPDLARHMAKEARGLRQRAEQLRNSATTRELFNLDTVLASLSEAERHADDAPVLGVQGDFGPPWVNASQHARRAVLLAEHIERYS